MRQIAIASALILLAALPAKAADPPIEPPSDAGALSLADETPAVKPTSQSWRLFGEGALAHSWLRNPSGSGNEGRATIDFRYDGIVAPQLRVVFSDRLDLIHRGGDLQPREENVNTLREAYLSWHATPELIGDAGRINLRYGAAFGYNPTDYFKANATRVIVSIDPASLRENRQGTVVLQGQGVWSDTSVSAAFSPKLADAPSDATFSMNFGATNPSNRWLVAASHKFAAEINPQLVLHGGEHTPTQAGLNLSGLVNRATVAYVEYSAGRTGSLAAQSQGLRDSDRLQQRGAAGFTYTTTFNLSLTAEFEYNSAAPTPSEWRALSSAAPLDALRLLSFAQAQQDLPVRQALFVHGAWRDMGVRNLDVAAFARLATESPRGSELWIEARYRWSKTELAVQWQQYTGSTASPFALVPQDRRAEVLFRVFL